MAIRFVHPDVIDVYIEDAAIRGYCRNNYHPEEVFEEEALADWAKRNGYVRKCGD